MNFIKVKIWVIITDFDAFILGLNPHSNWSRWMQSVMSKRRVDGKCVLPKFYTLLSGV